MKTVTIWQNLVGLNRRLGRVLAGLLFLTSLPAQAQLPELEGVASLSGTSTAARFFAGVSADNEVSFGSSFAFDASLDIRAEIQVDPAHVGSVGNLYILIVLGEEVFQRNTLEVYELWDGDIASLQPTIANKTLAELEPLTVVDDVPFGPAGVSNVGMDIFFAYDLGDPGSELIFHGVPLNFFIEAQQFASEATYLEQVEPEIIANTCLGCHFVGGIAEPSGLLFQQPGSLENSLANYNALLNYASASAAAPERLLNTPQGLVPHGGAVQIQPGSAEAALWEQFINELQADITAMGGGTVSSALLFEPVEPMGNLETLRKATLLFAGRLPTAAEQDAVADGSEQTLRQTIRGVMQGEGFTEFLMESANDRLLTMAFAGNMFGIVDDERYPNSAIYFQNPAERERAQVIAQALAEEPLRLIDYIVQQELPYTEVLTANYTVMNPFAAEIYNSSLQFDDPDDFEDWQPAQISDYFRCSLCFSQNQPTSYDIATDYPHAGVLSSPAFLSRYPSTETNRNRARARWTYYYFLGLDIEKLAPRSTDQEALQDENNPTLNNPNCTVCHNIMDPVAGAFQFYGDDGFYKDKNGGQHSLPASYRFSPGSGYQLGDTWYADMLAPGFGQDLSPPGVDSLQWLGEQMAEDSAFGYGTAYFWYPAIMGRDAYPEPENPADADYASALLAYNAEQELLNTAAADFVSGAAGNGPFNLKELLLDLVLSEQFRAATVSEAGDEQEVTLAEVGRGRLLTPEQLDRKLTQIMGFDWSYGRVDALGQVYNLVYGGIDSFGITERAPELTTLMSSVVTAMANETACSIVSNDFSRPASSRLLFPHVELSSLPSNSASAIRQNIQHLHEIMLGETLAADDPELDASYGLFETLWQYRIDSGKGSAVSTVDEICIFENVDDPVLTDSNQTLKSWAGLVNYLMRDYRFIHE